MNDAGDRSTPVHEQSPIALLAEDMQELKAMVRDGQETSKRTYDLLLLMDQRDKSFEKRIDVLEKTHIVLPIVSTSLAILALALIFFLHY